MNIKTYFKDPSIDFSLALGDSITRLEHPEAFFLGREFIAEAAKETNIPAEAEGVLLKLIGLLLSQKELLLVVSGLQGLFSRGKEMPPMNWPEFAGTLKDNEEAVNLLLLLSGLPRLKAEYDKMDIPQDVRKDTLSDISLWLQKIKADSGKIGITRRILCWLYGHFSAELYRLGRLQFKHNMKFSFYCKVYRNINSGKILALAENETRIDADGFLVQPGGKTAWTASLRVDDKAINGYPVEPCGMIGREGISLPAAEWKEELAAGVPVLDVHIPEGQPLTVDACRDSFKLALRFFPAYYSGLDFKAFVCSSWFFDPVFLKILKPSSNLLLFYKEFYCVPLSHGICTEETLWRVFGKDKDRLNEAEKETSMKKAIFEHYGKGGIFRESGAFILKDDVPAYGKQQYWQGKTPIGK